MFDTNNDLIYQADGSNFNWEAWYEPYARDWYWKGPEIGGELNTETGFKRSFLIEGGTYLIKVYNKDNQGSYSLAIGEAEFFGSNTWEKILTWTPIILYIGPFMDIAHWQKFDVRAPSEKTKVGSLSGGNMQKVILARECSRPLKLLLACQPTRGLDIHATSFIRNQIIQAKNQGLAVLWISEDLDELLELADRIAVIFRGKFVRILERDEASLGLLGRLMTGMTDSN